MMYILSKDKVYYNLKKNDSVTSQNRFYRIHKNIPYNFA